MAPYIPRVRSGEVLGGVTLARCRLPREFRKEVCDRQRNSETKHTPEYVPDYVRNMFVPPGLLGARAKSWRAKIAPTANNRFNPGSDFCKCACDAHDYALM